MKRSLTIMEIWAVFWFVAVLIMSAFALKFFTAGQVAVGVVSLVIALVFLMVAVFLVRRLFRGSPHEG